jgi:hypothetical protein
MTKQTIWYETQLPNIVLDSIQPNSIPQQSTVYDDTGEKVINNKIRNSKSIPINSDHWIFSFIWYYLYKSNIDNFRYDIEELESDSLEYSTYSSGEYYFWHKDSAINHKFKKTHDTCVDGQTYNFIQENISKSRKLSFILNLSDYNEYSGGNIQFLSETGKVYFAPRTKGAIIIFDSRSSYRIQKVNDGTKKVLFGHAIGPEWR